MFITSLQQQPEYVTSTVEKSVVEDMHDNAAKDVIKTTNHKFLWLTAYPVIHASTIIYVGTHCEALT